MPTIRKKGDKQYHVQIRKRGYPTQTKTFTSLVAAEQWATVIESEMVRGVFVSRNEAEATLIKDVLQRFETDVLPTKRGEQSDRSRIKTLTEAFGDYRMASLTSSQVAQFRDRRLKIVGPQSVIHELNLLNRVLKTASMDWGIALPGGLPTAQVRKPIKPRGRDRRVPETEIAAILGATESPELRTIIKIAVETGMRRNELASLTWNEIDLKKQTAHLPKTKTDVPRTVPLSKAAVMALREFGIKTEGAVFELRPESMSQAFERACEPHRANIVGVRFHDLRHEATSRLFEKGLNVMEVAAITGHKTLDMLKRYTHLRAEDLAKKLK
ncbi:MAG: site-specific integrase [Telluria sp.]